MAAETVRVVVIDTEVPAGVIAGATVRVFTTAEVFVTSAVTNGSGIADITVDGSLTGTSYHVRFQKDTVSFDTPQVISVYSPVGGAPSGTNDFEVEGDLNASSAPGDANLCRCAGYFRDVAGVAKESLAIRFESMYNPMIVAGQIVTASPVYKETDSDGYITVDLYRNSELMVSLLGEHIDSNFGYQRTIVVPDRSTCSLSDLLWPVPISVVFSPVSPIALTVGTSTDVTATVTGTNYQVLTGSARDDVEYTVSDTSVATVTVNEDNITLRGESIGSTTLVVSRKDDSIVRVPDTISGTPATINVT